jgi:hypothetical protein
VREGERRGEDLISEPAQKNSHFAAATLAAETERGSFHEIDNEYLTTRKIVKPIREHVR